MGITGVFITRYKEYPKEIDLSFFDEVIIKTESPNVYTRYLEAKKAKNDIIYVQDDDCIVDYRKLLNFYNGKITNVMTPHHLKYYEKSGITLVGWGCFFPKEMLNCFDKYISVYGEDSHLMREADRIFTYLNQPHNPILMPHQDINQVDRMSHQSDHYTSLWEAHAKLLKLK